MRKLTTIIIALGLIGCINQPQSKDMSSELVISEPDIIDSDTLKLYVLSDSLFIYSASSKESNVLHVAEYLDSFSRYNFYVRDNKKIDFIGRAQWFPIKFKEDTAYVYRGDIPALRLERISKCNLQMLDFYHLSEIGYIVYSETRMHNTITNKTRYIQINRKYSTQISDSLYLFSHSYQKVGLYLCNQDTFIYQAGGKQPVLSDYETCFYFFRNQTEDFKSIPLEIVRYDYGKNEETTLYTDSEASTDPCVYFSDGKLCNDIKVINTGARDILNIEINKLLDDLQDEGDYIKYKIVIDLNDSTISKTEI